MKAAAAFKRLALAVAAAAITIGCTAINLAPGALAGSEWRVIAINGRAMPAPGEYSMSFDPAGQLGARIGCNSMGGRYRIAGDTLTVIDLLSTQMACAEPAASFEEQGTAILRRPMLVGFDGHGRMSLSNATGSFSLERKD